MGSGLGTRKAGWVGVAVLLAGTAPPQPVQAGSRYLPHRCACTAAAKPPGGTRPQCARASSAGTILASARVTGLPSSPRKGGSRPAHEGKGNSVKGQRRGLHSKGLQSACSEALEGS